MSTPFADPQRDPGSNNPVAEIVSWVVAVVVAAAWWCLLRLVADVDCGFGAWEMPATPTCRRPYVVVSIVPWIAIAMGAAVRVVVAIRRGRRS